jgi:hypothetical protein
MRFPVFLSSLALGLTAAVLVSAQTPKKEPELPAKNEPPGRVKPPLPSPYEIAFRASPSAAPVPATRYSLFPRLRDRVPGNAATDYLQALSARPQRQRNPEESHKLQEQIDAWLRADLDKFPIEEVREHLEKREAVLHSLDRAALRERCDWGLDSKLIPLSHDEVMKSVDGYNELADNYQRLRIRMNLAGNDFAEAARNIAAGLRMSKDVAEGPTLVHLLVGAGLELRLVSSINQWIGRPDAPNLYWSLTTLPQPLIDPRPALEGELLRSKSLLGIRELEEGPVASERANQLLNELMSSSQDGSEGFFSRLCQIASATTHYVDAKRELIAFGWSATDLKAMPPAQVVILRAWAVRRAMHDELAKCFVLPYPQALAEFARVQNNAKKQLEAKDVDPFVVRLAMEGYAFEKVFNQYARNQRQFAGLRAIEAVRLHAASNHGLPPKQLADINIVSVPDDPFTGKPFGYRSEGTSFTLEASAPTGEVPTVANSFRYTIEFPGGKPQSMKALP